MPATVTLSTTTLAEGVDASEGLVRLGSTSGVYPGYRLYVDGELMTVLRLEVDPYVRVLRGVDGTRGVAHVSSETVYIGQAHQFYSKDPVGRPPAAVLVSPHINAQGGRVWFAQGDTLPGSTANRWWQLQSTTRADGAVGVRTTTYEPTSSS